MNKNEMCFINGWCPTHYEVFCEKLLIAVQLDVKRRAFKHSSQSFLCVMSSFLMNYTFAIEFYTIFKLNSLK